MDDGAVSYLKRWRWWYLCYFGGAAAGFAVLHALHWSLWLMIPIAAVCGTAGHLFIPARRRADQ